MLELLYSPWLSGIIGGIISSIIAFFITRNYVLGKEKLKGKHLYEYPTYYPIETTPENEIRINRDILLKSLEYFSKNKKDHLSAFELFSLIDSCRLTPTFDSPEKKAYSKFVSRYSLDILKKWHLEYLELLEPYQEIVNSIGETFNGLEIEFVLHRAINPIESIVALKNTVFGREIDGATTNFGLKLIKDYGVIQDKNNRRKSEVSYKVIINEKKIKSTTIPIYDNKYGLLGFLCLNIPIPEEKYKGNLAVGKFFSNLFKTHENKTINEIILTPETTE